MPTVSINLSEEDYAELKGAPNRSAKVRELLKARRTHKCPPDLSKDLADLKVRYAKATKHHSQAKAWDWQWNERKQAWE